MAQTQKTSGDNPSETCQRGASPGSKAATFEANRRSRSTSPRLFNSMAMMPSADATTVGNNACAAIPNDWLNRRTGPGVKD